MCACACMHNMYFSPLQYLTAIAVQLLKLGGTNEVTLTAQGLCRWVRVHASKCLSSSVLVFKG